MNTLLEQGVAGASHSMVQKPEVVIVAPTRELAIQIHREACKFSYNSVLKCVIIYGGTVTSHQRSNLQAGCNILVATAGRLKDFLERGVFDFSGVKFLILDEADRMLDMGFGPDIEKIAAHPTMPPKVCVSLAFIVSFNCNITTCFLCRESVVLVCFQLRSQKKFKHWQRLTWKTTYSSPRALLAVRIRMSSNCSSSVREARKELN